MLAGQRPGDTFSRGRGALRRALAGAEIGLHLAAELTTAAPLASGALMITAGNTGLAFAGLGTLLRTVITTDASLAGENFAIGQDSFREVSDRDPGRVNA